jgi:poly-gamma-glutamate biosynthesis protein PgsC/CapC
VHDYLFSSEIVRFAFVFGICVSMMLYERLHLTTGSIVVPGYIAVFLVYPMVVVATFVNALLSYALMNHVLRKRFMLYGRAKFTLMALISIGIQTAMLKLSPSGPWLWEKNIPLFVGAGYVVPALIAHDMGRQGIKRTTKAVLLAGFIVSLPIALALLLRLKGVNDLAPLVGFGTMSIANHWIPLAVLLSAAASWGVAHNYDLKSGGFVGAAYVGMFMGDPYQVAVAFTIALITFVLVRYVLMNVLILFGRRKFSAMLLTSSMISWTLLWVGPSFFSARVTNHLDLASMALTPLFVPGLLANDMDRTSPLRVVAGTGLAAAFVVPATWWIQSIVDGHTLALPWTLLAAASFTIIFWKSIRQLYRHYRPVQIADEIDTGRAADVATDDDIEVWTPFEGVELPEIVELPEVVRLPERVELPEIVELPEVVRLPERVELPEIAAELLPTRSPPNVVREPLFDIHSLERLDQITWPQVERRKAGRPWADRPAATVPAAAPEDLSGVTWQQLVPNVYSIDSAAWSPKGNRRWQDAHPDAWEDADRWLAEALTPDEFDARGVIPRPPTLLGRDITPLQAYSRAQGGAC